MWLLQHTSLLLARLQLLQLLLLNHFGLTNGSVGWPLSAQTKTFSIAHKPGLGIKPGEELLLFNYSASAPGAHSVTQSWFTGSLPWPEFGDTLIRYYIDGENHPSIAMTINNLVGLGDANTSATHEHVPAPWGNAHHGSVGVGGGRYTAIRIPFGSNLRVTASMSQGQSQTRSLYCMFRGLENFPVTLGGLQLPLNARLRSVSTRGRLLAPTEWTTLVNTSSQANKGKGGGALLMVMQTVKSGNSHCLEGTHLATIDGVDTILSSGFEDYYLSGQYFDAGPFATAVSGSEMHNNLEIRIHVASLISLSTISSAAVSFLNCCLSMLCVWCCVGWLALWGLLLHSCWPRSDVR